MQLARLLSSQGYFEEIPYPDISTKAKAQEYIGLDMEMINKEKGLFLENVVPRWMGQGREREKREYVE